MENAIKQNLRGIRVCAVITFSAAILVAKVHGQSIPFPSAGPATSPWEFANLSLLQDEEGSQPSPQPGSEANTSPPPPPPPPPRRTQQRFAKMHGHFFSTGTFEFWNIPATLDGWADFPVTGRVKVSENNSAIPDDRVFFTYSHFHDAISAGVVSKVGTSASRGMNADRYVLGFEKTFVDGLWSLELRTPLFGSRGTIFDDGFTTDGFSLGNLAVIAKWLVYESDTTGVAIGSAVSAPTGDDARFAVIDEIFTINNDTAHLTPYVAFLFAPGERLFYHGFFEVDFPAAGNRLEARAAPPGVGPLCIGRLNAQALASFDFSVNYWLYRNPMADGITAVTSALEIHYVTALQTEDDIFLKPIDSFVEFGNRRNRFDLVNLTLGFDTEIYNNLNVRVAGVVPITDGNDRFFDGEVIFSINRRF